MPIGPTFGEKIMPSPGFLEAIKDAAEADAEHRGGTIERDNYEVVTEMKALDNAGRPTFIEHTYFKWKMRRND